MTNARDKANIPVLNFQSKGIDDNADATAITIDSSERVGIATSSPTTALEIRGSTPQLSIRDNSGHGSIISWHGGVDASGRHGIYYGSNASNEIDINEFGNIYFSPGKTGGSNPHDGRKITMDTGGNISTTGRLLSSNGTASLPSLGFANDTNTGIFRASGDTLGFTTGGSERMRIFSGGNVSIGTTSDPTKLAVSKGNSGVSPHNLGDELFIENNGDTGFTIGSSTSGTGNIFFGDSGDPNRGRIRYHHNGDYMEFGTAGANEKLVITSAGNVGIGTNSPGYPLVLDGGSHSTTLRVQNNSPHYGDLIANTSGITLRTVGSYPLILNTNQTERMRIDSSGNVLMNTTDTDPTGNNTKGFVFLKDNEAKFSEDGLVLDLNRIGSNGGIQHFRKDSTVVGVIGTHNWGVGVSPASGMANSSYKQIQVSNGAIADSGGTNSSFQLLQNAYVGTGNNNYAITGSGSSHANRLMMTSGVISFARAYPTTADSQITFSESMRIDSSGNVLIGKTASMYFVDGVTLHSGGGQFSNTDDYVTIVNRNGTDGTLVQFRHATVLEGSISVSGTTVSYNGFTGTHWSRFTDNSTPTILKGTVLETLDEMCDWYNLEFDVTTTTQDENGNDVTNTITEKIPHVLTDTQSVGDIITYNHEETDYQATIVKETDIKHMKSKVSDTTDAKNVYGVFVAYDEDGEGYNDFYVASVGSFVVRIKQGETVAKGDLLQSNGDGTAKVQTDDAVRSSSFAKVLSTTIIKTYEDGSYLVPCSLMC